MAFKLVKVLGPSLHYEPTIWSIRKQKYLCKPSLQTAHKTITKVAKVEDVKYHHHISQAIKQRVMMQLTVNESQTDLLLRNLASLIGL